MADFYVQAGRALQDILARRGSIKAITAKVGEGKDDARAAGNAKRILALVVNTLSFRTTLQIILAKVDIAAREPKWFEPAEPYQGRAASSCPHIGLMHLARTRA